MFSNGWHPGVRTVHRTLDYNSDSIRMLYNLVAGDLDSERASFHSTNLPFLPITTLDSEGRPWASILSSDDGKPGFIEHPRDTVLTARSRTWDGDPLIENSKAYFHEDGSLISDDVLVAGIGIEFSTRRRYKVAGKISKLRIAQGRTSDMEISVNESLVYVPHLSIVVNMAQFFVRNCPKYINVRDLIPHPDTSPRVKYKMPHLSRKDRLPEEIIAFIRQADTVFLGTVYAATNEKEKFPSHIGMNQRAGRPGFVRVSPTMVAQWFFRLPS
ncbi:hypothetical protein MPER_10326 [Moniliophthora perniciosa FA553]|nr:hypothetical protein MPER_10326 [Moniliophthora perniciosa FA553]